MSKIRFPEINEAMINHPDFEDFMRIAGEMYAASPNRGQVAFVYAFQDQFRINVPSRAARSGSGSARPGAGWRQAQIAQFSGRGNKWIKVTGPLEALVLLKLGEFDKDGHDSSDYRAWVQKAGYAWIRYAGPRGSENAQELCFEVRIYGSRQDHPEQLLKIPADFWADHEDHRSYLGGTPFSAGIED